MGCKQYARMLGLSRGYPHILYLSLNKWDAAPCPRFSTRSAKIGGTMLPCHRDCLGRSRRISSRDMSDASDLKWKNFASASWGHFSNCGTHSYVDILENFTGRNS